YPWLRRVALGVEETPAARGARAAAALGCFACHGPGGGGGTHNPGSQEDTVPAFTEQTQMMYVKDAEDLREYILDGAPRRKREDPDYRARVERATPGQVVPDAQLAARGADLALELSCFACHGPLGAGGVPNPGSFKGYVPAFWGSDFDDLVHDDEELRRWIAEGKIARIADHPIGRIFFRRQVIKMPAYGRFRPPEDIDALVA